MVARLATFPGAGRATVPARTVLAVDSQSVRPFPGRVPGERTVLECRWRIEPSGRLACVWSVAPRLCAGPAHHVTSPPIQPQAVDVIECGLPAVKLPRARSGADHDGIS